MSPRRGIDQDAPSTGPSPGRLSFAWAKGKSCPFPCSDEEVPPELGTKAPLRGVTSNWDRVVWGPLPLSPGSRSSCPQGESLRRVQVPAPDSGHVCRPTWCSELRLLRRAIRRPPSVVASYPAILLMCLLRDTLHVAHQGHTAPIAMGFVKLHEYPIDEQSRVLGAIL